MLRTLRYATLALAALALTAGCEQHSRMVSAPGALPRMGMPDEEIQINTTTMFAHAHLLERQGAFERAVIQYQNVLADKPDFVTARNRLGITLNKLGRHAEATEQFQTCVAQEPTQAHLHNNLGFSLYLEERYAEAERAITQALKLDPDFDRAHMNHAIVLAKLGRHRDAFEELKRIGSQADACFNMGILLTEAGQYSEAAQYLEAALAEDPKFEAAREQLLEVSRLAAEAEARKMTRMASAGSAGEPGVAFERQPANPGVSTPTPPRTAAAPPRGVDIEDVPLSGMRATPAVASSARPSAAQPAQSEPEAPARTATANQPPAHVQNASQPRTPPARTPTAPTARTHASSGQPLAHAGTNGQTAPKSANAARPQSTDTQQPRSAPPAAKPKAGAPAVVVETIDLTSNRASRAPAVAAQPSPTPVRPQANPPARDPQVAARPTRNEHRPARTSSGVVVEDIEATRSVSRAAPRRSPGSTTQQPPRSTNRVEAVPVNQPGPQTGRTIARIIDLMDDEMRLSSHLDEQAVSELRCRLEALLDARMDAGRASAIEADTAASRLDTVLRDAEVRTMLKNKGIDLD